MARFILSRRVALRQYYLAREHCDALAYSYKTNPMLWEVLRETDSLVGVSSLGSMRRIEEADRVVYYLQGEREDEVKHLLRLGVKWFIVDNEPELRKLLASCDERIHLLLRVKMREHTIYTGKHFVYGLDWRKAKELISEIREDPRIEQLGIHFHRKTQNVGEWSLVEDVSEALGDTLESVDWINIGGGIPVSYANSKPDLNTVFKEIDELRDYLRAKRVKLMMEPGRFIASPSVVLEAEVLNVYDGNVILDCSIFNAYIDTYLLNVRLPVLGEVEMEGYRYLLKGRSPDWLDIFRYSVYLDRELKPGDKVIFLNAGAYNFHTEFNDMPKLRTEIVEDFPFEVDSS
ncbi:MAG: decarboxylase [Candidatus Korarchaeum sp.]|nr:decarboxylase [Candidatus Korarchaeum sp.]